MTLETSKALLKRFWPGEKFRFVRSGTSAVTTEWGVNWDEDQISRDIMQNFYDANRDNLSRVKVDVVGQNVTISAPAAFNLERLFYLGSEKGPDDIGQYGEGFKAASICLLRDHRVTPVARSGRQVVCMRIGEEPAIEDSKLFPLVYDYFSAEKAVPGAEIVLVGCSKRLIESFKGGFNHFLFDDNPLLGDALWKSRDESFLIYRSTESQGHVFYRRLKRGVIPEVPLILVINKEYQTIEKKTQKDRDRNAFGGALMGEFYRRFANSALRGDQQARRIVIEATSACWTRGHPLLSNLAETTHSKGQLLPDSVAREIFKDKYFARSKPVSGDLQQQFEFNRIEKQWQGAGRQALPEYFHKFGVPSARDHFESTARKALKSSSRRPSPAERECIAILSDILRELAPEIMGVFDKRGTNYTVAKNDEVLGQLKEGRHYGSREVVLAEQVFTSDFAEALAVFLHEHSHIFGYDGSRGFTDALTDLLATVVRERKCLDEYEPRWDRAKRALLEERRGAKKATSEKALEEKLSLMTEAEIREVLSRIPQPTLKRLLDGGDSS